MFAYIFNYSNPVIPNFTGKWAFCKNYKAPFVLMQR